MAPIPLARRAPNGRGGHAVPAGGYAPREGEEAPLVWHGLRIRGWRGKTRRGIVLGLGGGTVQRQQVATWKLGELQDRLK